jgi:hypothetical protein
MIGIALDLRRPAFMTFNQQANAGTRERHGSGVEQGLAGHDLFGLPDVGDDRLVRLSGAGAHASQCQRRAHQFQEAPATDGIEPLRSVLRKLAMKEFLEFRRLRHRLEAAPVVSPT